jgi:hypothetical protein
MIDPRERRFLAAGWLFAIGTAVHVFDHLRRGQGSVSDELYWLGNVALVLQVIVIMLVFTRHRLAPLAAVALGFPLAVGFAAAHWLPEWSAISDPLWEISSWTWFSAVASTLEIVGAVAIAFTGLAILRHDGVRS